MVRSSRVHIGVMEKFGERSGSNGESIVQKLESRRDEVEKGMGTVR